MFCSDCGADVDEHAESCPICGALFTDLPADPSDDPIVAAHEWEVLPDDDEPYEYVPDDDEYPSAGGLYADEFSDQFVDFDDVPHEASRRPLVLIGAVLATAVATFAIIAYVVRGGATTVSSGSPAPTADAGPVDGALPQVATTSIVRSEAPANVGTTVPAVTATVEPASATPEPAEPTGNASSTAVVAVAPPLGPGSPTTNDGTTPVVSTTDGGPATVSPATTIPPTSGSVKPVAVADLLASISGSAVRADNVDSCGASTSYQPLLAVDGRDDTAWMVNGNGADATLTLTMKRPITVSSVGLVPGYAKRDACNGANRFLQTRRILEVRWTFDDANPLTQTFDPTSEAMQRASLGTPVQATTVTITIVRTTAPGTPPLDYTAIAEVAIG